MSDFNETYADAINSNSEERTSSMSDYSTSTTPNETRYQENTPTVTPEIVDAGTDVDLVETNPVAALAGNFQDDELTAHPLAPGETNYTEQEALQTTEDLKVKSCTLSKPSTISRMPRKGPSMAISGSLSAIPRA